MPRSQLPTRPTSEPGPAEDADRPTVGEPDAAGVEERAPLGPGAEAEDSGALLEERTFLVEEERKTGEVDLLLIRLDRREIRVDGEVEREVACGVELDLASNLPLAVREMVVAVTIRGQRRRARRGRERIRAHVNRVGRHDAPEAHVLPGGHLRVERAPWDRRKGPSALGRRLVGVGHHPHDDRSVRLGLEPQARERNPHLAEPTFLGDPGLEVPMRVPRDPAGAAAGVDLLLTVPGDAHVQPGPERETDESHRVLVVVEGVEEDAEAVVSLPLVARQGERAEARQIVVVDTGRHIERLVVVCDEHLDAAIGRPTELGLVHRDREGLDSGPGRFVAHPVQLDGSGEALNIDDAGRLGGRSPHVHVDLGPRNGRLGTDLVRVDPGEAQEPDSHQRCGLRSSIHRTGRKAPRGEKERGPGMPDCCRKKPHSLSGFHPTAQLPPRVNFSVLG